MSVVCPVVDKISGIFRTAVVPGTKTAKYGRNGDKMLATNDLDPGLVMALKKKQKIRITKKMDGSCAFILMNPTTKRVELHKRRDVKPGKMKPSTWFQINKRPHEDDDKMNYHAPDHNIGFMPLEEKNKDDQWFFEAYPLDTDGKHIMTKITALVPVLEKQTDGLYITHMEYKDIDINTLENQSVEFMGPKINGNPHKLQKHCIVPHGCIELKSFPDLTQFIDEETLQTKPGALDAIKKWFNDDPLAPFAEGVVIHLPESGRLYKLHRHHLDMPWDHESTIPLDQIRFAV